MAETFAPSDDSAELQSSPGRYWKDEIERASKYFEKWQKRVEKIERIYLEQRSEGSSTNKRNFPMLWANVSVLQPAVYARQPVPAVDRRFKDKDPVGRAAAELLERCLTYSVDRQDLNSTLKGVRDDFLIAGRGQVWIRYEATLSSQTSDDISESQADEMQEVVDGEYASAEDQAAGMPPEITGESAVVDYVHWSDFLHSPARRWKDVSWVARRVSLERDEFVERFGENKLATMAPDPKSSRRNDAQRAQDEGKFRVWEIWCKASKQCYWIGDGASELLDQDMPPLDFADFFPCPQPAYATVPTSTLIPVPDYVYYQGHCEEIDTLTDRIAKLTDQMRLKGFYPGGGGDVTSAIEAALAPNNDNVMVPIPSWAAFAEKGGSQAIVWLPIKEVMAVYQGCVEARQQLIEDVYQITGISDIVRGDSQASETATAQRIKSQWGSIRIRDRQQELARFCRDVMRLMGEVIAENFQPQTLVDMSGLKLFTAQAKQEFAAHVQQVQQQGAQQAAQAKQQMEMAQKALQTAVQLGQLAPEQAQAKQQQLEQVTQQSLDQMQQQVQAASQPPEGMDQPSIDEIVQLLHDEPIREFRIDIETDSTIQPDEDGEKQRRIEFLQAIGGFIQQSVVVAQQMPSLVPAIGEMILFVARAFRAGRQLENVLEEAISQTSEKVMAPKPPPQPSPDEQVKLEATKVKAQTEIQKSKLDMQTSMLDHQQALERHKMDMQKIVAQQAMPAPMAPQQPMQ